MKNSKNKLAEEKFELEQKKFNIKILNKLSKNTFFRREINGLDISEDTPEKAFSNVKYYRAMKEIPLYQKKALFLLVVCEYSILEVAQILDKKPSEVLALSSMAINTFKKNLRRENFENGK